MIDWTGSEVRIDLANVAGTPGARGRYEISEKATPTDEYEALGPVEGWIEVENTGVLLLMRGQLRARVRVHCVRCLAWCECPLLMEIEEEFATKETAPDVLTIDREEPETSAINDFMLDVSELVRQQLAVNLPMAQLCREDCKGICPECGRNLNLGPCTCATPPADSKWQALADLLPKLSEGQRG